MAPHGIHCATEPAAMIDGVAVCAKCQGGIEAALKKVDRGVAEGQRRFRHPPHQAFGT